ncbi:MAG: DUF362 domain-containing protein [bacterium]|nr:DUF362 domain-containing protein [bacterium]
MTSKKDQTASRRAFLRQAGIAAAAASGVGLWGWWGYSTEPVRLGDEVIHQFKNFSVAANKLYPEMVIAQGQDVEQMVRGLFESMGGVARFVSPHEKVLLKPNVGWDRQPEQAANTGPELVGALCKILREARAEVLVVDHSINDPARAFHRSGIEQAAQEAGAKVLYGAKNNFVETDFKGEILKVWPALEAFHQVDKVINLPIAKHHSLSNCTLSMKNWYGVIGGRRNRLHQKIHQSIADLAGAIHPTLTILDATRVLRRNGPTGGNLEDVTQENCLVASLDEVALDTYAAQRWFEKGPDQIDYLKLGQARGLGTTDWKSLNTKELQL